HILSATYHDVSVLSTDKEKDVLFHSNPTAVAEEKETVKEKINELCRKAFSTKAFKDKIDRKHEMFLMVHMAKADGVIEEQEKKVLAQTITGLHGFTNKEKAELFGLMSASTLPVISPTNAYFSSKARAEEAKKKIIELVAKADGDYEPLEKAKVDEINKAIEAGYKAKPSGIGRFFKTWQVSGSILVLFGLLGVGIYFFGFVYPQMRAEKKAKRELKLANEQRILDSTLYAMNVDPSTLSLSEFTDGKIISKKTYFYEDKEGLSKTKSYCKIEDNVKYFSKTKGDFYYTIYTPKKGKEIKGWVNKSDITQAEATTNEAITTAPSNDSSIITEIIAIVDGYFCGDGNCSFNVKKENGKDFEQAFDFKYNKDESIIINSEAKDMLLKDKDGTVTLNAKYKGKKAKITYIKEKRLHEELVGNNIEGVEGIVNIITKIEWLN
ncbi:MAG TPA: TerB family tellurite resistance protein, partial [Bacteroidia bacterium]